MKLTKRQKQVDELGLARDYWAIKAMGSIDDLWAKYGVSKQGGLNIVRRYSHLFSIAGCPPQTNPAPALNLSETNLSGIEPLDGTSHDQSGDKS